MQDTSPCETVSSPTPALAPSTAPAVTNDMAINPLRIPTPKENIVKDWITNKSDTTSNDTKESNQTKVCSVNEEISKETSEENSSNNPNLVSRSSESITEEVGQNKEEDTSKTKPLYTCSICNTELSSSQEFSTHIRSHNNFSEDQISSSDAEKAFVCRLCGKVLSSANSLDRHMLVHSGERPFLCRICGVSFTTNGNMHRHMRTHSNNENGEFSYESDASSDSLGSPKPQSPPLLPILKKRRVSRTASEFNNNIVELSPPLSSDLSTKRKSDSDELYTKKRKCDSRKSFIEKFDCSLCEKTNFLTLNLLETHIEECHPEYKAKCNPCNLIFKNHRVLNLHRYMVHHAEIKEHLFANTKQETIGFKDLTFVDFSSEKFPHIARVMCEQSLHHASSLYHRFQCEKCTRAFPCGSALNIHRQGCGNENYASSGESCHQDNDLSSSDNETPTDLSSSGKRTSWGESKVSDSSEDIEDQRKRYNFFACLDLQNNSTSNTYNQHCPPIRDKFATDSFYASSNGEGKDLADIQSIISVASVGGLLHDLSKSPQPTVLEVTPPDSGSRGGIYDSTVPDEEQQDCFAAEFRKMKLRGEFPCRLCTAVFPNLRALKGHNRVHLSSNGGQSSAPYRCNMCPHFSSDKSALIRHMRTHNGDRPYECALCHYAFTTKANCERHLRNRHAKMTREEVKKSIIYHPSEDPTNEINDHKPSRDDVKRSLFCEKDKPKVGESTDVSITENVQNFVKNEVGKNNSVFESIHLQNQSLFNKVSEPTLFPDRRDAEINHIKCLDVGTMTYEEEESDQRVSKFHSNIPSKEEFEMNSPLDLSMDVLDLSKKKNKELSVSNDEKSEDESDDEAKPQDLSKKSNTAEEKSTIYPLSIEAIEKSRLQQDSTLKLPQGINIAVPSPQQPVASESPVPPCPPSVPKLDLSKFYPPNTHPFFATSFPQFSSASSVPTGPYPPYFFPPPPPVLFPANTNQEFFEMKERLQKELIRGLQLTSGGSLVFDQIAMANTADRLQAFHQQALAEMNWRIESSKEEKKLFSPSLKKEEKQPALHEIEKESKAKESPQPSIPEKLDIPKQDTSSSVKMVIKNGVLIPKQKQRRYRTERPFSCEHCSARFTLRSNMERHIKQQHPQFWSQRQRNAASIPTRRNHSLSTKIPQSLLNHSQFYSHTGLPIYNAKSEDDVSRSSVSNDHTTFETRLSPSENKPCISEEVKNAIAQQLKSKNPVSCTKEEENDAEDVDEIMDEEEEEDLVIDEETRGEDIRSTVDKELPEEMTAKKLGFLKDENLDLASVSRLLDNASTQTFRQYFHSDEDQIGGDGSDEDEEGLVAAGSTSEGCNSGSDENRSESETNNGGQGAVVKKKSAYSLAPNRVSCPYCFRKFPWSSSLRRHVLTHTGQKPYKCSFCPLLFTTKSNCDRHLLRKHGGGAPAPPSDVPATVSNESTPANNSPNYTMRNVPERPYKCKSCPSSTFSTLSNLKKHLSTKHQISLNGKSDGVQSGYESQGSISEEIDVGENESCKEDRESEKRIVVDPREIHPGHSAESMTLHFMKTQPNPVEQSFVSTQPSDLPFKCHLCEGSFGERQEALDHIRDNHCAEFQLLVSKGALEVPTTEETQVQDEGGEENLEQLRGKFPDYANRKVMCAFCLRRFWSAEDLRRHMRTHTGERPFSCDICRRRFTLKHSMLRHRKKHSFSAVSPASDDENTPNHNNNNNNNVPSINSNSKSWMKARLDEESDLISNLLGIQDKTIVDKMLLSKSADDAAKLLGVQK